MVLERLVVRCVSVRETLVVKIVSSKWQLLWMIGNERGAAGCNG